MPHKPFIIIDLFFLYFVAICSVDELLDKYDKFDIVNYSCTSLPSAPDPFRWLGLTDLLLF